jgi:RNA polymerase-binding transcription factor DksA
MTIDTNHFKKLLETEKKEVETELKTVGRINPENPGDWEATPSKMDIISADRNEVADSIDSYEENTAILKELEIRLRDINAALDRIDKKTYGKCSVCGKEIEKERLEANPAATTCMAHIQDSNSA